jgi:hypothetical protein
MMRFRIICFCKYCFDCLLFTKLAVAKNNQETKLFWNFYKGILPFYFGIDCRFTTRFFIVKLLYAGILPVTLLFFGELVGIF